MQSYKHAGVDVVAGDSASRNAYRHAQSTFSIRNGKLGSAVRDVDGFSGLLDMGTYSLTQNDDGVGTKSLLSEAMERYDTLGYDLLAMVADDAVCCGAEVFSVTNAIDVPSINQHQIDRLLSGLAKACREQHIVIAGGEIAEVPDLVQRLVWNATAIGMVAKNRVLKPETIVPGDHILALRANVARSNGFSLIRKILENQFGQDWFHTEWKDGVSWGEIFLSPSKIYHRSLLRLLGKYNEKRPVQIKALAHITGGGIPGNLRRILKHNGLGAKLDALWEPHPALLDLVTLGNIAAEEAYQTWCMGNGMLAVVSPKEEEKALQLLTEEGVESKRVGIVTQTVSIELHTKFAKLRF